MSDWHAAQRYGLPLEQSATTDGSKRQTICPPARSQIDDPSHVFRFGQHLKIIERSAPSEFHSVIPDHRTA
jgi:hypothetical protein